MAPERDPSRLEYYIVPLGQVLYAIYTHFSAIFHALQTLSPHDLRPSRIRAASFAKWYSYISGPFYEFQDSTALPHLISNCHGTVLEIGPGDGAQLPRFDRAPSSTSPGGSKISRIYGIEPNPYLYEILCERVRDLGMEDLYVPILGGAEDKELLERHGIAEGTVDCILCVQVLCSVPDPRGVVKDFYKLLKPGGMLVFWEHHASRDRMTRAAQWFWNQTWPLVIGGCRLDGRQDEWLLGAGEWEVLELGRMTTRSIFFRGFGEVLLRLEGSRTMSELEIREAH